MTPRFRCVRCPCEWESNATPAWSIVCPACGSLWFEWVNSDWRKAHKRKKHERGRIGPALIGSELARREG